MTMRQPRLVFVFAWLNLVPLGCNGATSKPELEDFGAVADFRLSDQDGRPFSRSVLVGKVWIASFIFTRCTTLCPQIVNRVGELQQDFSGEPGVHLVSFSVDPENDKPEVLKAYALGHHADLRRWTFLTGPEKNVYELVSRSFMLGVAKTEGPERRPGNEVTHSSRLVVVDRRGHIRGYFEGRQVDDEGRAIDEVPKLLQAVKELLRDKP
jgi:protein SCO1/2